MGEAKRRREDARSAVLSDNLYKDMMRFAYEHTCDVLDNADAELVEALSTIYISRNAAIDTIIDSFPQGRIACGDKCAFCCHQMVTCRPFEIFVIAKALHTSKSAEELQSIRDKLWVGRTLPLVAGARYGHNFPCPLLVQNSCAIYADRPMACRQYVSSAKQLCQHAFDGLTDDPPFNVDMRMKGTAINVGIDCALYSRGRLDVEPVELCRALLLALDRPDESFDIWINRGSPFAACKVQSQDEPSYTDFLCALVDKLQRQRA
jgi:Fe-S-cluster containining protein